MKQLLIWSLILILPLDARASDIIQFSARIQNEALAEEAIDLLHCLSEESGFPWELSAGGHSAYGLDLEEKEGKLAGIYHTPEGDSPVALGAGDAGRVCGELSGSEEESGARENFGSLDLKEPERKPMPWVWIGASAAVLLGGFLYFRSRGPDHSSLRMN